VNAAAGAALVQGLAMRHDVAKAAADQWHHTHQLDDLFTAPANPTKKNRR
jgi:hypothetical protein